MTTRTTKAHQTHPPDSHPPLSYYNNYNHFINLNDLIILWYKTNPMGLQTFGSHCAVCFLKIYFISFNFSHSVIVLEHPVLFFFFTFTQVCLKNENLISIGLLFFKAYKH